LKVISRTSFPRSSYVRPTMEKWLCAVNRLSERRAF
jgi:hypothetical protein